MAISLTKGGNLWLRNVANISKEYFDRPGFNPRATSGDQFDLDASAFLVGETRLIVTEIW